MNSVNMSNAKVKPNPSGALVLVIDDDMTTQVLAKRSLENAGFKTVLASNGQDGLKLFNRNRPDIVLLDVEMPIMNGFKVCREIRSLAAGRSIPILMITGLDDIDSIENAYSIGATDFATKPVNWAIMVHRVRYLLRSSIIFKALEASKVRLAKAQKIANLGNWDWDIQHKRMFWSDQIYKIFSLNPSDASLNQKSFFQFVHPEDRENLKAEFQTEILQLKPLSHEYRIQCNNGDIRYLLQQAQFTLNSNNEPIRLSGTIQDISERKITEEKIRRLAYHDSLTGLLNRNSFQERLETSLCLAKRNRRIMAVLYLDLDNFKRINDTLGHDSGDLLLKTVAQRLIEGTRRSDAVARIEQNQNDAEVARLGGDEFTILLSEIKQPEDAGLVAQRILDKLSAPVTLNGHNVFATPSIGIAVFPEHAESSSVLLKNADTAMYHAKQCGKGNFQYYTEQMNDNSLARLKLESDLHQALKNNEFRIYYQPIIDSVCGQIIAAESLLRWQSKKHGLVKPCYFIPMIESNGMIVEIGKWVLKQSCNQNAAWQNAGLKPIRVSVNISSLQFRHANLLDTIEQALETSHLSAEFLILELTEGMIMQNSDQTIQTLQKLKAAGVKISIDDFGTGYSSLSYLKRFPIDTLKIDKSFISDLPHDKDDAAITTAVIAMAHSLNLRIIAEGVEKSEQAEFLKKLGCHSMQGYLFGKPMSANDFQVYLKNNQTSDDVIPIEKTG